MRKYIIYVCECCNKHYIKEKEALTCEASHIGTGLTIDEYEYYNRTKGFLELDVRKELSTINDYVKEEVKKIKQEFNTFKAKHGITDTE